MPRMSKPKPAAAGGRRGVGARRFGVTVLAVGAAAILPAGQALAESSTGAATTSANPSAYVEENRGVIANVEVYPALELDITTSSFTLYGLPGDQPEADDAVALHVFTNNPDGYQVSIWALGADLTGSGTGNTGTIPVTDLSVRENGTTAWNAVSTATVQVYTQATPSAGGQGDALSNDWEFNVPIPAVSPDTYSDTIEYMASTNP